MRRRRIGLGILATLLDKAGVAGTQLMLVPVLSIHWGIPLYGCWVLLSTMPTFLSLGDLGFSGAASARLTAQVARGETEAALVTFHSAWRVVLASTGLLGALGLALVALAPDSLLPAATIISHGAARLTITLLIVYTVVAMAGAMLQTLFRSHGHFALGMFLATLTVVGESLAVIVVVLSGRGLVAAAATLLIWRLAGCLVQGLVLGRILPEMPLGLGRGNAAVSRSLVSPAMAAMALPIGTSLALQGSVMALGAAAGVAAVPAFAAARTLSRIALQLSQTLAMPLMPEFGAATAREDRGDQVAMILAVLGSAMAVDVPAGLVLAIAGPWLIGLWTHGYIVAAPELMVAMGASAVLGGIWNPLSNLVLAVNRQAAFTYHYIVLGALSVGATWLFAGHGGATTAALSSAVLDAAMAAVVLRFVIRNWLAGVPLRLALETGWRRVRGLLPRA